MQEILRIHRLIDELRQQGKGVVVITHDEKMAAQADRVIVIRDGRIHSERSRRDLGEIN
jgi:ABC-type lipoprotein export system ATPase subunit